MNDQLILATLWHPERYNVPVMHRIVELLPKASFRPEPMRVTCCAGQGIASGDVWYEVETFNADLSRWIAQKSHKDEHSALADARNWYPFPAFTGAASSSLKSAITCRGSHHGQLDLTITLRLADTVVGHIDYVEFRDTVHIQYMSIDIEHRRKGYARHLLQQLQAQYPDVPLDPGMLCGDGAMLWPSLPVRITLQLEIIEKQRQLTGASMKRDSHLQLIAESRGAAPINQELISESRKALDELNDLHDLIATLEDEVNAPGVHATKTFILFPQYMQQI